VIVYGCIPVLICAARTWKEGIPGPDDPPRPPGNPPPRSTIVIGGSFIRSAVSNTDLKI
jgi:hypothetical protein